MFNPSSGRAKADERFAKNETLSLKLDTPVGGLASEHFQEILNAAKRLEYCPRWARLAIEKKEVLIGRHAMKYLKAHSQTCRGSCSS